MAEPTGAASPDGSLNDLARQTETDLRCVALCATSLADTLMLARHHAVEDLDRLRPEWFADTRTASAAAERQLIASVAVLDRRLAVIVQEVALRIRESASSGR